MKYLIDFKLFENIQKELTKNEIIKKASHYKSSLELRKKDTELYKLIVSNHLLNTIFPKEIKWTIEKIKEEAKKYKTRGEFQKNAPGAYIRATGFSMLDKLYPKK